MATSMAPLHPSLRLRLAGADGHPVGPGDLTLRQGDGTLPHISNCAV